MKQIIIFSACFLMTVCAHAQGRYFTKTGRISIYSNAPMEDIEASTKTVAVILDAASGAVQFQVVMKSFEFKKALMQEHFNSDYVESDKFPSGEFKGTIINNAEINYTKPGTYPAKVRGKLTMHGVTKDVAADGTVTVAANGLQTAAVFNVSLSDFNIRRPSLVRNRVSNTIQITVDCKLDPLNG